MKHTDMPVGSVITLGHPHNLRLAVKTVEGRWRLVHDGTLLDPEDFRGRWDLFVPQYQATLKVEMIKTFGFTPVGSSHEPECPYSIDSGNRCNCVKPETVWAQPVDVATVRHETFAERRAISLSDRLIPSVER